MSGKKYADANRRYDRQMMHEPAQAIDMVRTFATAKFDESVDLSVRLGVDPRKADQMVRGANLADGWRPASPISTWRSRRLT